MKSAHVIINKMEFTTRPIRKVILLHLLYAFSKSDFCIVCWFQMPGRQPALGSAAVFTPPSDLKTVHVDQSTCFNLSVFKGVIFNIFRAFTSSVNN